MEKNSSREIIAYKLYAHADLIKGYIRPVAEWNGEKFIPLTNENFCPSGKVFVTSAYDELDSKYDDRELFKVTVFESQYRNPDIPDDRTCIYVTQGFKTTDIKPREFVEVLLSDLPDPNFPVIDYKFEPSTTYIYLVDNESDIASRAARVLQECFIAAVQQGTVLYVENNSLVSKMPNRTPIVIKHLSGRNPELAQRVASRGTFKIKKCKVSQD